MSNDYTVFLFDNAHDPEHHFRYVTSARAPAEALQHTLEMYADLYLEERGYDATDYRSQIDTVVAAYAGRAQVFSGRHDSLASARATGRVLYEGRPQELPI